MKVVETVAKTALVKSKLPGTDYVINPYTGCAFACAYCYASFMGKYAGEAIGDWGNYVYVKTNLPELVAGEMSSLTKRRADVLLSSVTDAWQYVERKYGLTRRVLEALLDNGYCGHLSCLTKSPLVTRDVDLLRRFPDKSVGFTITTTEDVLGQILEVRAPKMSERIAALAEVAGSGIETYAFIGPVLPHYLHEAEKLRELFAAIAATGTRHVYVERLNASRYIMERLKPAIAAGPAWMQQAWREAGTPAGRDALNMLVTGLAEEYGLVINTGKVIEHGRA